MKNRVIRSGARVAIGFFVVLLLQCVLPVLVPGALPGLIAPAAAAGLTASVNRNEITIEETLTLKISAEGGINGDLNIDPLGQEFEVISTSQSRQVQIVDGQMSNVQSWNVELLPKRLGYVTIPALSMGGVETEPLRINVLRAAAGGTASTNADIFVEAEVSTTEPWVQSEVVYIVRLFQAINILDGGLSDPTADQLITHRLGDDVSYLTNRGGRQYRVQERKYALFAQESGEIVIPPVQLTVTVSTDPNGRGGFFGQTKTLRRRGPALTINVQPRPDGLKTDWWLPASQLDLREQWSNTDGASQDLPEQVQVGVPLTRTINLRAQGVVGEQLPVVKVPEVAGLKIYQDKPQVQSLPAADTMTAVREEKWAVIAQTPGPLVLPEITISWFDTAAATERFAVLPSRTINVVPAAGALPTPVSPSQSDALSAEPETAVDTALVSESLAVSDSVSAPASGIWAGLAAFALAGWLVTAAWGLALLRRNRVADSAGGSDSVRPDLAARGSARLSDVKVAIKTGKPTAIAASILAWGQTCWPEDPPRSLQSVAQRSQADLALQLRELDRQLYSSGDSAPSNSTPSGSIPSGSDFDYSELLKQLKHQQEYRANTRDSQHQSQASASGIRFWQRRSPLKRAAESAHSLPDL